jgi:hypothetical protein
MRCSEKTFPAGRGSAGTIDRACRQRGAVNRTVLLGVLFAVAVLVLVIYSTMGNAAFRCTVCMDYQGRSACRTAAAATREQALRAATENACAQIASGVTDSIGCDGTPPTSVKWLAGR